ncbi:MAG: polyprenyl synthetase family protein [Candidatus Nanopelagicales bacterium]
MPLTTPAMVEVDGQLATTLAAGLAEVEALLQAGSASEDPFVAETVGHLRGAGGKRFRPTLTLLAAQFGDHARPQVVQAAAVVELTHLATLYHDDVMDEAPRRRGTASANAKWGNTIAILAGDLLFARASELLAELGPEAVRLQARTFARLCTGQIRETAGPGPTEDPVTHHLSVLAEKTGSLIATSARFGALLSGAPSETVEALTEFGERIGVAFQLADDLMDITSDSTESGKTPGTDLREGIPTLAVLDVRGTPEAADARLLALIAAPISDDADHAEALRLLRKHPAVRRARAEAHRWSEDARTSLHRLPPIPARDALEQLCDYVVERTS